jgi:hypothetical protein
MFDLRWRVVLNWGLSVVSRISKELRESGMEEVDWGRRDEDW